MIPLSELFMLINLMALFGAVGGYLSYIYVQLWRPEVWPVSQTIPLLGSATILALLASGLWISGPVPAIVIRALIATVGLLIEMSLIWPALSYRDAHRRVKCN